MALLRKDVDAVLLDRKPFDFLFNCFVYPKKKNRQTSTNKNHVYIAEHCIDADNKTSVFNYETKIRESRRKICIDVLSEKAARKSRSDLSDISCETMFVIKDKF